jgi:hypothetical protein
MRSVVSMIERGGLKCTRNSSGSKAPSIMNTFFIATSIRTVYTLNKKRPRRGQSVLFEGPTFALCVSIRILAIR